MWVKLWIVSSTGDHWLAVELQKLESALIHEESSMLPTFMNFTSEFSCTKETNGEPHSAQKPLEIWDPPDPVTVKNFNSPSTFNELFENKVTLITTSNTHPDNLYKDGLHRSRFLTAIESIKENCEIYELNSAQDYRLRTLEQLEIFLIGKKDGGIEELDSNFSELTNNEYQEGRNIQILGRKIKTIKLSKGSVWLSFQELCEGPRSAKDYIEICSEFHTLFVSHIPILGGENDDSARRFIALIDECYERNVNLILALETDLDSLYAGERLIEPFKRTISRLEEMRSREYLSKPHLIWLNWL